MEESIVEVIIGEVHHGMMVMSGPHRIISPHKPNDFLEEESFSIYFQSGSGLCDSIGVCSQPMRFTHDTLYFQFDCQYPIGI